LLKQITMQNLFSKHSCIVARFIFLFVFITPKIGHAQVYKEMMDDVSFNFYEVVTEAEQYFLNRFKGKGSGYKDYLRWRVANEAKYYPSGDRSLIDPYFAANAYKNFVSNNPSPKSLFYNGWEEIGPNFVEQITGHYSVGLGRSCSFYIDPSNTQRMYLGSASGGFWKTTDGGSTWTGTTDFLMASGINTIAVSPTNSDSVLIDVSNTENGYTHGIYRSIDGGSTWNISNFNPTTVGWGGLGQAKEIYQIKYHPTLANLVFIGTRDGLYRSTDNLATWTVPLISNDFTDIDFHPTDPTIVYAYAKDVPNAVFVSTNSGVTFTQTAIIGNGGNVGVLDVSAACVNCVYFASGVKIWKSIDNGTSFNLISSASNDKNGFAVNDLDTSKMLSGYVDGFFSNDGGLTFNQITFWSLGNTNGSGSGNQTSYNTSTNYIHADLQTAECINGIFYAVTDGFLVKSEDNGVTWIKLSNGTGIRMNYNLGLSQSNQERTICGSQDNGTSIHGDTGWIEFTGGDGMEGLIHPLNDDWMVSSYQYGSHLVTKDGGITSNGATPPNGDGYWIAPLVYDPNDHMTLYHFSDTVHITTDFTSNWNMLGSPAFGGDIKYATIAENNSKIMIVARDQFIEKSIDGGLTFTNIKGTLPNLTISDVVFDPKNDSTLIVTYSNYQNNNNKIYVSHNQGATWTNISYNLGNMPIRSAVIDHTNASTIYIGTEIGVYKKAMNDVTWTLYNPDLPNVAVSEMEVMWGSNTLRASTMGRGLWEFTLDGRTNYPSIVTTDITNPPTLTTPVQGMDQFVTSTVLYDLALTSVYVKWSLDTATFGNTIAMSNTTGTTWVSNSPLPSAVGGAKLFFKVFAVGTSGDTTETYKFMYTIKPLDLTPCIAVQAGEDDAEETVSSGAINLTSSDLELCYDGYAQLIGVRFQNIGIPVNSTVNSAYINFSAKDTDNSTVDVNVAAHNVANSGPWSTTAFDISSRVLTAPVIWSFDALAPWTAGVTVAQSPNLAGLVQQIIDLPGWSYNNSISFVLWNSSGDLDNRNPYSSNGGTAPSLCIDFTSDLSLSENKQAQSIQLVPNPSKGKFELIGKEMDQADVFFVNSLGQSTAVVEITRSEYNISFDCSTLASGIYFVQVTRNGKVEMKKLVIEQ
jgi:hypothetical protein